MSLVSVIVATYRREAPLKRTLLSLAEQSFQNIEIILVDDNACPDWNSKVSAIVESFRKQHPSTSLTHIINEQNLGSARSRNAGIDAAAGKYITFLDDDDLYLPGKIEQQFQFMEQGNYDYTITDLYLYDESDRLIDRRIRSYIRDTSSSALLEYHLKYHITGTDTMMFLRSYLQKIGGFAPIDVGDEFYLMQRAIAAGGKFGYLSGCQVKAYIHTGEGGLSSGDSKIQGEMELYRYKQGFFGSISKQTIRYIKVRHYAVIAFAQIRRKQFLHALANMGKGFLISPVDAIKLIIKR